MARHLARLKLSLLASAFRRNWQQAVGLVVAFVVGIPVAVGVFALVALAAKATEAGPIVLTGVYTVAALGWLLGPILLFGVDETLDPSRLRLLPLTRRQLATGLLAASALGVGPLCTLLALSGGIAGYAPAGPGALVIVAAVGVQFLLCLVLGRAGTTALAGVLRSRRGRDATALVAALVGVGFALLAQAPNLLRFTWDDPGLLEGEVARVVHVLGLVPTGWAARAIVDAAEGQLVAGLAWVVAAAALVGVLAWWWVGRLEAALVASEARSEAVADRGLFPRAVGFLPRNRLGAAAARELWYIGRDPQLRAQWLTLPLFPIVLAVAVVLVPALRRPEIVLLPAALASLQTLAALNAFGADRGASWLLLSAGGFQRSDLAGKNVAVACALAPVIAVVTVFLAAVTGGWAFVPVTLLGAVAMIGIGLAVGDVTSVLAPFPMSQAPTNPFSTNAGMGCSAALIQMLGMLVVGVLAVVPIGAGLAAFFLARGWLPVVAVLGAAYGLGVWWAGLTVASNLASSRGPELVATLGKWR